MPIGITIKNKDKVFAKHLQPGECALVVMTTCRPRGILGITDQNRVIQTTFPLFWKSKLIQEYYISDILSCECSQIGSSCMVMRVDVKGQKKVYKSSITPVLDSKALANTFVALVREKNGNTRPAYLSNDKDTINKSATISNIDSSEKLRQHSVRDIDELKIKITEKAKYKFAM